MIGILMYLFGAIFIVSALLFAYYALRNTQLIRGALGHRFMAAGSITSIVAFSVNAIEFIFLPGPIMVLLVLIIWFLAISLILFGGILREEDIRRVLKISRIESIRMLVSAKYYLIGIPVLVLCYLPLRVLGLFYGYFGAADWIDVAITCTLAIAFVSLVAGERRFYLSTQPSAAVVGGKEIGLLKSDMLAVKGCEVLTNTFLARVKPAVSENLIRKTLADYFEYNPILFEGCGLKEDGSIDVAPVMRNLDRISRRNKVQTVCTLFSRLNSKVMNLYGAVTSPERAQKTLEDSYVAVKKQYGDIFVFFDILRTMPKGVLENEKLALLSKEELEAKVSQRTRELEEILKELAEAKEYVDSVIKSMVDILIVADLEGRMKTINRVAGEILGYEEDDLIGQPVTKIFTPAADSLSRDKVLEKLKRGGIVRGYEMGIKTKDGRMVPVDLNASPIMEHGELKAIQLVARDITERKQAEEALKESEEKYRNFVENISDVIYAVDKNGVTTYVSPVVESHLGYSPSEIVGRSFTEFVHHEDLPRAMERFVSTLSGNVTADDYRLLTKSGEIRWMHTSNQPILEGSHVVGTRGVLTDITERKQTEEELRNSREQLRDFARYMESARERERTRIARELHDQMGQALTALKMDLSGLDKTLSQDQIPLREKTKSMLELTDTAIKTVKRLATELRPGVLDDLGLTAAIEWQAEEFQQRTGIECELSLYPEDINLDEVLSTAIFRVLQEALTNVARHARATRVKVSLEAKAGKLVLQVIDNGRGVTQKQISAPKSLGLVGMRERVLPWQGEVKISGVEGEGTMVMVRIPLSKGGEIL